MTSRPVLCAVDISNKNQDLDVLKIADKMARVEGMSLDVITVVPDFGLSMVGSFFEPHHHEQALEKAREVLGELVVSVIGEDADEKVRHVVATGNAYEEILKIAKAIDAGLIVIGAQKPEFKDYLLGPNASRVVRHSECSVMVVR